MHRASARIAESAPGDPYFGPGKRSVTGTTGRWCRYCIAAQIRSALDVFEQCWSVVFHRLIGDQISRTLKPRRSGTLTLPRRHVGGFRLRRPADLNELGVLLEIRMLRPHSSTGAGRRRSDAASHPPSDRARLPQRPRPSARPGRVLAVTSPDRAVDGGAKEPRG